MTKIKDIVKQQVQFSFKRMIKLLILVTVALVLQYFYIHMIDLNPVEFAYQFHGGIYAVLFFLFVAAGILLIDLFMGDSKFELVDYFLGTLWLIAFLSYVILVSYMLNPEDVSFIKEKNIGLLSSFFILLSASIASASIMKSIKSNEKLKKIEISNEHKAQLLFMIHVLSDIKETINGLNILTDADVIMSKTFQLTKKNIPYATKMWKRLSEDKYFIFIVDNGYEEYQILDNKIIMLEVLVNHTDVKNRDSVLGFANSLPSLKREILVNIEALLNELTKQLEKHNIKLSFNE